MDITTDLLPWDSEDQALWRAFLDTQTGRRLIPKMLETLPPLLGKGDVNEILIRSGDARGFGLAARTLLALAHPAPQGPAVSTPGYAPLEDDSAWNDGQKITT